MDDIMEGGLERDMSIKMSQVRSFFMDSEVFT